MVQKIFDGVYRIGRDIATYDVWGSSSIYGEKRVKLGKEVYRVWNPFKSKLSAYINKKGKYFPFYKDTKVLYLGAASGTTVSHIADIVVTGIIYAVEFSARPMRDFLIALGKRDNIVPIFEDAAHPERYSDITTKVDVLYQDIAQKKQAEIFIKNAIWYLKKDGYGILMIKTRSIDVTKSPSKVAREETIKLKENGFKILEKKDLTPFDRDHRVVVVRWK